MIVAVVVIAPPRDLILTTQTFFATARDLILTTQTCSATARDLILTTQTFFAIQTSYVVLAAISRSSYALACNETSGCYALATSSSHRPRTYKSLNDSNQLNNFFSMLRILCNIRIEINRTI